MTFATNLILGERSGCCRAISLKTDTIFKLEDYFMFTPDFEFRHQFQLALLSRCSRTTPEVTLFVGFACGTISAILTVFFFFSFFQETMNESRKVTSRTRTHTRSRKTTIQNCTKRPYPSTTCRTSCTLSGERKSSF